MSAPATHPSPPKTTPRDHIHETTTRPGKNGTVIGAVREISEAARIFVAPAGWGAPAGGGGVFDLGCGPGGTLRASPVRDAPGQCKRTRGMGSAAPTQ